MEHKDNNYFDYLIMYAYICKQWQKILQYVRLGAITANVCGLLAVAEIELPMMEQMHNKEQKINNIQKLN